MGDRLGIPGAVSFFDFAGIEIAEDEAVAFHFTMIVNSYNFHYRGMKFYLEPHKVNIR